MCIRDSTLAALEQAGLNFELALNGQQFRRSPEVFARIRACLLYTSDAADERSSVDLGGRRIIKKKTCQVHMAVLLM